jgi:vacuolar protein sorting-associated protein 54
MAKLRGLLKDVDERTAKKGLEVVRKCREVERVQGVRGAVKGVGNIVEMTKVAKSLVGAGQWGEALNVVEELERMWDGEQASLEGSLQANGGSGKKLETMVEEEEEEEEEGESARQDQKPTFRFPLSALMAFTELPSHLRVLTLEIAANLSQELILVLRHDLEERVSDEQGMSAKANGHVNNERDDGLRNRLNPVLQNLVRARGLKDAISQWRDVVLGEVRKVAKEAVSGFDKEWDEEKEENRCVEIYCQYPAYLYVVYFRTALVQHFKDMEHSEFMPVLQKVYKRFLALVEGVHSQNGLINHLLESIQCAHNLFRASLY